jgi:hypothetical protein
MNGRSLNEKRPIQNNSVGLRTTGNFFVIVA